MKLLAGVIIILVGVVLHIKMGLEVAWYFYLGGLILIIVHFLFGTVIAAFNKMNNGDVDGAEKILSKTKYPKWLSPYHQSYYYWVLGMIDLRKKRMDAAERHLKKSLEIGKMPRNSDNALAALNLTHIYFLQKKYTLAKEYLTKAKSFKCSDLMMKEHLEKMEKKLGVKKKKKGFL